MSDAAHAPVSLRQAWQNPVPHAEVSSIEAVAFISSGQRVVVGASGRTASHSVGSLTVLDTRAGGVVRQITDDWQVSSLAISPDGRSLATSESRGPTGGLIEHRVRILDADTFVERSRYTGSLERAAEHLIFSRNGDWVAALEGASAFVFDVTHGTERWRRQLSGISGLASSADGRSIAIAHQDGVAVLDALTGADRLRVTTPSAVVRVAPSPDNRWIVAGCADGAIRVVEADTGTQAWSVQLSADPDGPVASIAVSDDAQSVAALRAVGVNDRVAIVGVYDLSRGTPRFPPLRLPPVRFGNSGQVLYSPTLRHIAVSCPPGGPTAPHAPPYITLIDARTGREQSSASGGHRPFAVAGDGASIAAGTGRVVTLYDLGLERSRHAVEANLTSIDISPGGTPLIAVANTSSAVTVIAAANGTRLARRPIPGTIAATAFADSGEAVAAGGSNGVRLFSVLGDRSWKVDTIGPVNALAAVGPAGEWIATAAGRTVRLLSSADGHSRWPSPNTHPQTVTRVASSRDGTRIATGCADRKTRIIDAVTGAETFSVEGDGRVRAVVFQANGPLLATGNEDGTVVLIDAATAAVRGRITRPIGCSHLAFNFDATMLAAAWDDNTVSVFAIDAGSPPPKLHEFASVSPVSALAFNPAGNNVAVAAAATSVAVFDARSGTELARIVHQRPARDFAFSADGTLIATISEDNIVRVWENVSLPATE
jgi:WD40 repeat protein